MVERFLENNLDHFIKHDHFWPTDLMFIGIFFPD